MPDGDRRVIAGVSGSLRSLGALRAGVVEARASGSPVFAVLAWVPPGGEYAYRRAPCPVLLQMWEDAAAQRLAEAFDEAFGGVPEDVLVHRVVARGKPGPVLVALADRPDDLIVLGSGGHTRAGLALPGGVGGYCLAHARCPVLGVPPPDLMAQVRSRPHRWRPEDVTTGLAPGRRGQVRQDSGSSSRAVALTSRRPEARAGGEDLPTAYRGVPYYQPRRQPWRQRLMHRLRLLLMLSAAIAIVVATGLFLASGTS